jgi:quercetin dioxygenase-like cupin family protein
MRASRIVPLSLAALTIVFACRDRDTTSPAAATRPGAMRHAQHEGGTASVDIPAPHGFTSQVLVRGAFVEELDAQFKLNVHQATTVVHVKEPSEMVMAKVTIVPGGALPWHTHPGPALVTLASGELTLVDSNACEVRTYAAGASFMDPGQGHVHVAFNRGTTDMVLYVTYLAVPKGQSPLVPVESPGC